jgi:hypothetical protein
LPEGLVDLVEVAAIGEQAFDLFCVELGEALGVDSVRVGDEVVGVELGDGFDPADLAEVLQEKGRNTFECPLTSDLQLP